MRCQFCGWENPETKSTCEKCNQPLQSEGNIGKSTLRETDISGASSERHTQQRDAFNPKATVREKPTEVEVMSKTCPKCGYNLDGEDTCPCCGASITSTVESVAVGDFKKTIRPNHNLRFNKEKSVGFRLVKLSESGQTLDVIQFKEAEVALNRDNTDSSNKTITSQTQAIVKNEGDKWMIMDQSELCSTYVQASRPIELQSGDLILLGDQIFRFENI